MAMLHGMLITETPEEFFLDKANTIDRCLTRTNSHGEIHEWDNLKTELTRTYQNLNPKQKDQYHKRYEDLSWEINFWKETIERESIKPK